jgi:LacI family transcriptional regulator
VATIKDIAREAGVSTATVSHVINITRFVGEERRQRVLKAIRDLRYRPNAIARSLVKQRTHTIGVLISDILNPFYTAIVRGIEDVTSRSGYNVILCNTDEDPEKERLYIRVLMEKRIDGLILSSAFQEGPHPLQDQFDEIPLVCVVRKIPGLQTDAVAGDNVGGAFKATEHLIGLGHRRIGLVCGPSGVSSGGDRLKGTLKALRDHGIPVDARLIRMGDFKPESGYRLTREILDVDDPPTALFVTNNQMTLGALRALEERGIRVPQGLSLVSMDDMEWSPFLDPPMTTVEHSPYGMGKKSGEMVLQRIGERDRKPRRIIFPSNLVIRKSTGPPPGRAAMSRSGSGKEGR